MMPISLYDIEQAELKLATERKRAANPNEGPPDFHDGVRFGEAAATAEARALVADLLEALETGHDAAYIVAEEFHEAQKGFVPDLHARMDDDVRHIKTAIEAARAWLGEAQKGDGHG